jgi:hypothetical protein
MLMAYGGFIIHEKVKAGLNFTTAASSGVRRFLSGLGEHGGADDYRIVSLNLEASPPTGKHVFLFPGQCGPVS